MRKLFIFGVYYIQILAVEQVHNLNYIHRDLKPDNLLLNAKNGVQIGDFVISHMFEDGEEDPEIDNKNASPLFSAPETCEAESKSFNGKAVDIWALGILLYVKS